MAGGGAGLDVLRNAKALIQSLSQLSRGGAGQYDGTALGAALGAAAAAAAAAAGSDSGGGVAGVAAGVGSTQQGGGDVGAGAGGMRDDVASAMSRNDSFDM